MLRVGVGLSTERDFIVLDADRHLAEDKAARIRGERGYVAPAELIRIVRGCIYNGIPLLVEEPGNPMHVWCSPNPDHVVNLVAFEYDN